MKKPTFLDPFTGKIIEADREMSNRIFVCVPVTGLIRIEWAMKRWGQVIPCNWSQTDFMFLYSQVSPLGYQVADARNICVKAFLESKHEWLWFIDHDVILQPITIITWNKYLLDRKVPIFGGLYFTKSVPSEPLIYRGNGNSYFTDWHFGDKVWVDGMGLGNHVIHRSILQVLWDEAEPYKAINQDCRKIFETPSNCWIDKDTGSWFATTGTEDLNFYRQIIKKDILRKAGWKDVGRRKWPFLCDTSMFSFHIDQDGKQYPSQGEHTEFVKTAKVAKRGK